MNMDMSKPWWFSDYHHQPSISIHGDEPPFSALFLPRGIVSRWSQTRRHCKWSTVGGFLSHGGVPRHHRFEHWIFHPSLEWFAGTPILGKLNVLKIQFHEFHQTKSTHISKTMFHAFFFKPLLLLVCIFLQFLNSFLENLEGQRLVFGKMDDGV